MFAIKFLWLSYLIHRQRSLYTNLTSPPAPVARYFNTTTDWKTVRELDSAISLISLARVYPYLILLAVMVLAPFVVRWRWRAWRWLVRCWAAAEGYELRETKEAGGKGACEPVRDGWARSLVKHLGAFVLATLILYVSGGVGRVVKSHLPKNLNLRPTSTSSPNTASNRPPSQPLSPRTSTTASAQ